MPGNTIPNMARSLDRVHEIVSSQMLDIAFASASQPLPPAAQREVARALTSARGNPYSDGDQSALPRPTTNALRAAWSSGLDVIPAVFCEEHAFSLHRAAWQGDLDDVRDQIRDARKQVRDGHAHALNHLLEARLSKMRLTPLHYACLGARTLPETVGEGTRQKFYHITRALLEAGARANARDIAGYTPLSTAAGFMTTVASLRLVPLLIAHGALLDVRTRFGECLLVPPIMARNVEAFTRLLRAGADVNLPDATGLTPRKMIEASPAFLLALRGVRREQAAHSNPCANCDQPAAPKICSACRAAFYCSMECQKRHWKKGHRAVCNRAAGSDDGGHAAAPDDESADVGDDAEVFDGDRPCF